MILKIILSAGLLYCSFPNFISADGFPVIAWFFAVPLLDAMNGLNVKKRLIVGLLFGLTAYSLLISWLWPVHAGGAILFACALDVQAIIFSIFLIPISRRWLEFFYVPALWSASEYARTQIFGGFCWSIGYSQSFYPPFIQIAAWTGPYGVAFILMTVNYCLWRAWRCHRWRIAYLIAAIGVIAVVYGMGQISLSGISANREVPAIHVAALQGNIAASQKADLKEFDHMIDEQMEMTRRNLPSQPVDLLVWSETAFAADIFRDKIWYPRFKQLAVDHGSFFLFGAVPIEEGRYFNSAVLLNPAGDFQGTYHKQRLVPFSEYTPSGFLSSSFAHSLRLRGFAFSAGSRSVIFDIPSGHFGVMICSEICYPSLARGIKNAGAGFAVVTLNDGWFTQKAGVMMHAQNTIMRAVENGIDIISVGNTGLTAHVDAAGRIVSRLPLQEPSFGTFDVSLSDGKTFYARNGDFFAALCSLFVIIIFVYQSKIASRRL